MDPFGDVDNPFKPRSRTLARTPPKGTAEVETTSSSSAAAPTITTTSSMPAIKITDEPKEQQQQEEQQQQQQEESITSVVEGVRKGVLSPKEPVPAMPVPASVLTSSSDQAPAAIKPTGVSAPVIGTSVVMEEEHPTLACDDETPNHGENDEETSATSNPFITTTKDVAEGSLEGVISSSSSRPSSKPQETVESQSSSIEVEAPSNEEITSEVAPIDDTESKTTVLPVAVDDVLEPHPEMGREPVMDANAEAAEEEVVVDVIKSSAEKIDTVGVPPVNNTIMEIPAANDNNDMEKEKKASGPQAVAVAPVPCLPSLPTLTKDPVKDSVVRSIETAKLAVPVSRMPVASSSATTGVAMPAFNLRDVTQSLRLRTPAVASADIHTMKPVPLPPSLEPVHQGGDKDEPETEYQAPAMSSSPPSEKEVTNPFVARPKVARTPPPAGQSEDHSQTTCPTGPMVIDKSAPMAEPAVDDLNRTKEDPALITKVDAEAMPTKACGFSSGCQTDELDLEDLLATKESLTRQELELREELSLLREDLDNEKMESEKVLSSWTQAQIALKESGKELDGIQRERKRLSMDLSRLTRELATTKEHIQPLVGEGDAAREEMWQLKLAKLVTCNELTGSFRVFDRLCERERKLKINLLHEEAVSYQVRSVYLKDYRIMCGFSRSVTLKALELADRVKERVHRLKDSFKIQQDELKRQVKDADNQAQKATEARNDDLSRLEEMESREAEHQKAVQLLEEGKAKAEKRIAEAEGRADKEVKKLEALLEDKGGEIKRLEKEIQHLRSQGQPTTYEATSDKPAKSKSAASKAKVAKKRKAMEKEESADEDDEYAAFVKKADLSEVDMDVITTSPEEGAPPKKGKKNGNKKRQAHLPADDSSSPTKTSSKRGCRKKKEADQETTDVAVMEEETPQQTFCPLSAETVMEESAPMDDEEVPPEKNESKKRRGPNRSTKKSVAEEPEPVDKRRRTKDATGGKIAEEKEVLLPKAVPEESQVSSEEKMDECEPETLAQMPFGELVAPSSANDRVDQGIAKHKAPAKPRVTAPAALKNNNPNINVSKAGATKDKIKKMSIFSAFVNKGAAPKLKKPT